MKHLYYRAWDKEDKKVACMLQYLSDSQWEQYQTEGYLRLGKILTDEELGALQRRMDDIMLGKAPLDYGRIMMQLDRIPGAS